MCAKNPVYIGLRIPMIVTGIPTMVTDLHRLSQLEA
jgi:hypothetical protein